MEDDHFPGCIDVCFVWVFRSTDLSGLRQVWKRRMFSREQRTKLAINALHIITIALTSFSGQWCILALFGAQLPKHSLHEETNVPFGAGMIHHQFPMNSEVVVGEWINQLLPTCLNWRSSRLIYVLAQRHNSARLRGHEKHKKRRHMLCCWCGC